MVGVDSHVLRYWETEFKGIKPRRGKSKQRLYRQQDVRLLLMIRQLLHGQGYTIAGAKKVLTRNKTAAPGSQSRAGGYPAISGEQLSLIKQELEKIQDLLRARKKTVKT